MPDYKYDVFIISPIRNLTSEQYDKVIEHIELLNSKNKTFYWPYWSTKQEDNTYGYNICSENRKAIEQSKEVHVLYDKDSQGSLWDLGMAFMAHKSLIIINLEDVPMENTRSFANVICFWEMMEVV